MMLLDYKITSPDLWTGRKSNQGLYLHEKVKCVSFDALDVKKSLKTIAILGYECDEGVKRNEGRIGAAHGPDLIRKSLGKFPSHLPPGTQLLDIGSVCCVNNDMEIAQAVLSEKIAGLLDLKVLPIVLGGGHDMAYGHYNGIKKHLGNKKIGIINFDAHFDLRQNENGNHSGTPFYQIAQDCKTANSTFNYLCLGIRKDANDAKLFETAAKLNIKYVEVTRFNMHYIADVQLVLKQFIEAVDAIYTTIDLDGFSSAYAPGVSAPSPMGVAPDIVLESLKIIIDSKKLISLDIAEMNPTFDVDGQTAKLAASLIHYVMHHV